MATLATSTTDSLVHRFRIGELDCIALSDGYLPSKTRLTAPEVAQDELAAFLVERGEHPTDKITQITCLLVDLPDVGLVLVDTGHGRLPGPNGQPIPTAGQLPRAFAEAGIEPAAIEHILISHIHPDHFGGTFDDQGNPRFPNATYHVPKEDVDFWAQEAPELGGSLLPPPMAAQVVRNAHDFLKYAGDRLHVFPAGGSPLPGVGTILLDGHTPGQVGFLFESGGEAMLYSADAAHHHLIALERPDWRFSFDADSPRAIATRKRLVAQLADNQWYNFTPHFPWPSFGRITRIGDRMVWKSGRADDSGND